MSLHPNRRNGQGGVMGKIYYAVIIKKCSQPQLTVGHPGQSFPGEAIDGPLIHGRSVQRKANLSIY